MGVYFADTGSSAEYKILAFILGTSAPPTRRALSMSPHPTDLHGLGTSMAPKHYKFRWFGDIYGLNHHDIMVWGHHRTNSYGLGFHSGGGPPPRPHFLGAPQISPPSLFPLGSCRPQACFPGELPPPLGTSPPLAWGCRPPDPPLHSGEISQGPGSIHVRNNVSGPEIGFP